MPCNAQYLSGIDCHIDYWQVRTDYAIDTVEDTTQQDLSLVQDAVNRQLDKWGAIADDIYEGIPCVGPGGPVCW